MNAVKRDHQQHCLGLRGVVLAVPPQWATLAPTCCIIPEESVIEDMLKELPGIEHAVVFPDAAQYTVYYQPDRIEVETILRVLRLEGYEPRVLQAFTIVG
jgi:copper chaperone CopZ